MSVPRFTPGKVKTQPVKPPHGQSAKTLTIKVKAHTRQIAPRAPKFNPAGQPITPGSAITAGQAARMAANASTVRYGPQQQQLQQNIQRNSQLGVDQAGWYDAYLRELQQHRDNIAATETASNQAVAGLANSLRSVDQSTLASNQQANNADAANRGATAGAQTSTDANNASLVRQALMGSFGAELAGRGKSATDYADTLAHVVGPGQKLQAQAGNARSGQELLSQLAALKGQSGAYKQQFIDSLTQQEAKNVLAASIASGRDLTALAKTHETVRHNKAQEKIAANNPAKAKTQAELNFFNKHGYLPPTGPPKPPKAPAKVKPTAGPGSLAPAAEAKVVSQIHQVVAMIQRAPKTDSTGVKLTDHELRTRLASTNNPFKKVIDPRIVNIAFDLARLGGLSTPNVGAAHDLGIHVDGHFKVLSRQKLTASQKQTANNIFRI